MSKRSYSGIAVIAIAAIVLVIGMSAIFRIRLVSGDLYPEYSSLRAEPDGVKLLFDSLGATGRFELDRKYKPLSESPEKDAAVLYIGYPAVTLEDASDADLAELEHAASEGNRVVIALGRSAWSPLPEEKSEQKNDTPLFRRWHVHIKGEKTADGTFPVFDRSQGWTAGPETGTLERAFGTGSLVLATSSDPFINRTLADDHDSDLLMWFVGSHHRVVFDETHLGVAESGSLIGLVRKYRLSGALLGLLLVAIVFVWKNAVGFPPPEQSRTSAVAGFDSRSGLVQILRRQIPQAQIVDVCLAEWGRSHPRAKRPAGAAPGDPLLAWAELQQEITTRK